MRSPTPSIAYTASDASRESASRLVGSTTTVPRHPMNIFYNAGTYGDEVSEYNWIYTSGANGGSDICTDNGHQHLHHRRCQTRRRPRPKPASTATSSRSKYATL